MISPNPYYRPDIDGLRAIAVCIVVLYHLGLEQVSGGFIGVDVFLIISGFLITSLLCKDIDNKQFKLLAFWERRVRRLFPAMIVLVGVTVLVSLLILFPPEYRSFAKSVAAQSLLLSNFLFWDEAGYFEAPSHFKPLLHTWSLSLEEQFYIFFPILLIVCSTLKLKRIVVLACAALLSLIAYNYTLNHDPSAAFFLLPFRAWEFLLGALLAVSRLKPQSTLVSNLLCLAGLSAIIAGSLTFNGKTTHGLVAALTPCLAAIALIWGGSNPQALSSKVLGNKVLVGLGLISYSLYLWHWPIIVLSNYHYQGTWLTSPWLLGTASLILGYLSWRFIETPIRLKRILKTQRALWTGAALSCCTVIGLAFAGVVADKFFQRFPSDVLAIADTTKMYNPRRKECRLDQGMSIAADKLCTLGSSEGKAKFMIWGDSHADAMMPLFDKWANDHALNGLFLSYSGCPTIFDVYRVDSPASHQCGQFNQMIFEQIKQRKIKHVILVSRWSFYPLDSMLRGMEGQDRPTNWASLAPLTITLSKQLFSRQFAKTLTQLLENNRKVWLVTQVPLQHAELSPKKLASDYWKDPDSLLNWHVSRDTHNARQAFVTQEISKQILEHGNNIKLLEPDELLCNQGLCTAVNDGISNYRDDDHLSKTGALRLMPMLAPLTEAILNDN